MTIHHGDNAPQHVIATLNLCCLGERPIYRSTHYGMCEITTVIIGIPIGLSVAQDLGN